LKVADLKRYSDHELAAIHGIGRNALEILKKAKGEDNR
jgi:DNA-binding Xre family transcriptional regulator